MTARRAADALRVSLSAGVPMLVAVGDAPSAYGMALVAAVTWILRLARAPARADLLAVTLLALDSWLTALGAFDTFNKRDTVGHLLAPAAVTPVLFHLALRLGVVALPGERTALRRTALVLTAAALTIALGTVWELVEYGSDRFLGTRMSLGYVDTELDLAADTVGSLLGAIALVIQLGGGRRTSSVERGRRKFRRQRALS